MALLLHELEGGNSCDWAQEWKLQQVFGVKTFFSCLGKTVTAIGPAAITERTRHAMKLTGRRTHFSTQKNIGPLDSVPKHPCIAYS